MFDTVNTNLETFSLALSPWAQIRAELLLTGKPVDALETYLLKELPRGSQLIRWAVVRIEGDTIICEGAYATGSSPNQGLPLTFAGTTPFSR